MSQSDGLPAGGCEDTSTWQRTQFIPCLRDHLADRNCLCDTHDHLATAEAQLATLKHEKWRVTSPPRLRRWRRSGGMRRRRRSVSGDSGELSKQAVRPTEAQQQVAPVVAR